MEPNRARTLGDAAITFVAVFLAVAALDDITTDHDTSFLFERLLLAGCSLWFGVVGWRLAQEGRRVLGFWSVGVAMLGAVAQLGVRPSTEPGGIPGYLGTVAGLLWFLVISGAMAVRALRSPRRIPV